MNPGPIEEIGETSRTFITALKDHPSILVMAVCNLALIVFLYFGLYAAGDFRKLMLTQQYESNKIAIDLLSRCIVPEAKK